MRTISGAVLATLLLGCGAGDQGPGGGPGAPFADVIDGVKWGGGGPDIADTGAVPDPDSGELPDAGDTSAVDTGPACSTTSCKTAAGCALPTGAGACVVATCEEGCCATGAAADGAACDDTDPCTVADGCAAGLCTGITKTCDDGDACTEDSCLPTSGACAHKANQCPAATECQLGACDAATGLCSTPLSGGWCLIGGACVKAGTAAPGKPCMRCEPVIATAKYSQAFGVLCEDGDPCTFGEQCDKQGQCKGQTKTGCCTKDAACGKVDVCSKPSCDLATNTCKAATVAGCCVKGACCDEVKHQILPQGTTCGGLAVGAEYKCEGADIKIREIWRTCTGVDGNACSKAAADLKKGPWKQQFKCKAGTVCGTDHLPVILLDTKQLAAGARRRPRTAG